MKKNVIIASILFLCNLNVIAQGLDSLKGKFIANSIYRFGTGFKKGNDRINFNELKYEFNGSSLGLDLYTKAKRYKSVSRILSYTSLFAGLAAISTISGNSNRNTTYMLLGGQMLLSLTGARYRSLYIENMDRAIWQRNQDVLFPSR